MPKFSVKKPFTVLVGVILALVLGFVSLSQMSTDLLPTISLPYLMVMTTYPGASPEQVESSITAPLEAALGTINGVENVTSTSSENFGIVMLEFAEDTNMDSAMVKATTKLNQIASQLPERAGTPTITEITADMMATQYLAVDYEGMDIYELSEYVQEQVIPALERIDGVAQVDAVGLVEKTVEVKLNQEKIDKINDKILSQVSQRLKEAMDELDKAKAKIDQGQAQISSGQSQIKQQQKAIAQELNEMLQAVEEKIPQLEDQLSSMEGQLDNASEGLMNLSDQLAALAAQLETGEADTFAALHAFIAQNAPDWYAAYGSNLPWSIDEILNDPYKLELLIEGLEKANQGISYLYEEYYAYQDTLVQAQEAVYAAQDQVDQLYAMLEEAQNPEPSYEVDPETGETIPVEVVPDEAAIAELQGLIASAEASRGELQAELDAIAAQAVPEPSAVDPAVIDQIIFLLNQAQEFQNFLNGADETLENLSWELMELNEYREELADTLRQLQENPMDGDVGSAAAQLLLSGVQAQLAVGQMQLSSGEAQLAMAQAEYDAAREEALNNANLDQLLNMQTLAQIIGAQNFSMPAGYIADENGEQFLLKVGDAYESVEELSGALLVNVEGVGDVHLSDVADITIIDNAGDAYAKVNGNEAILLSIYKGSTASTSEVSDGCNEKAAELMEADPNLGLTAIMDQGEYIRLIISTVSKNLVQGALLAVIVLIFFLKDARPTLVVAVSIPLSVLVALIAMYFSGISLNIISLCGLALGIGMLVDNSIVVIENIYRLRNRDVPAARAAVQGTRQVAGSIISSTITTICVFLPMIFTSGLVRQLMMDLALTITFSLLASLVVAMTVVPCAGSTVLKKSSAKKHPWFDKLLVGYDKSLRYCLKHKILPLGIAIALMVVCLWQIGQTGMVLLPEISSNQMSVTLTLPEGTQKQEAYESADQLMEAALEVPGIASIGAMSSSSVNQMGAGAAGMSNVSSDKTPSFSYFLVLDEEGGRNQEAVEAALTEATQDLKGTVTISGSSMADTSALMGSGIQVDIYGQDLDKLLALSHEVMEMLAQIPGITDISNGQKAGDTVISLVVDKDEAMRLGLTVAQVYTQLAQALTTDAVSTTLTVTDGTYAVNIVDTTKTPNLEDILDFTFETEALNEEGKMVKTTHTLGEIATLRQGEGVASISRENLSRYLQVTTSTQEGYNTSLIARDVQEKLEAMEVPDGYTVELAGESTQVNEMVIQMAGMMALALLLIYLVMVAQFQSLLSPFIVLFTIPLAFTGGFLAMLMTGHEISLVTLMGFLILMGVVVNNGIVFVDYANQLRIGGLPRIEALVATGKTRMRPILMTTLTTVLSMVTMLFSSDPGSEMGRGMAVVIVGGLLYATLMTLYIVPVMYDMLFRKKPVNIDVGDDLDDLPDDAAEFLAQAGAESK